MDDFETFEPSQWHESGMVHTFVVRPAPKRIRRRGGSWCASMAVGVAMTFSVLSVDVRSPATAAAVPGILQQQREVGATVWVSEEDPDLVPSGYWARMPEMLRKLGSLPPEAEEFEDPEPPDLDV